MLTGNANFESVQQIQFNISGRLFIYFFFFFLLWRCDPMRVMASLFLMFLDHTQQRTTVRRTPLDGVISSSQRHLPDNTQHSQQTNIHAPGAIRTHDLSRRAAADLRLRPRGHWDRQYLFIIISYLFIFVSLSMISLCDYCWLHVLNFAKAVIRQLKIRM